MDVESKTLFSLLTAHHYIVDYQFEVIPYTLYAQALRYILSSARSVRSFYDINPGSLGYYVTSFQEQSLEEILSSRECCNADTGWLVSSSFIPGTPRRSLIVISCMQLSSGNDH